MREIESGSVPPRSSIPGPIQQVGDGGQVFRNLHMALGAVSPPPQVIENCPVTGIRTRVDDFGVRRVAAVETEHGSIQTPCVVNCAGGMVRLGSPPQLWSHPFLGWEVRTGRNGEECPVPTRVAAESVPFCSQECGRAPWARWLA